MREEKGVYKKGVIVLIVSIIISIVVSMFISYKGYQSLKDKVGKDGVEVSVEKDENGEIKGYSYRGIDKGEIGDRYGDAKGLSKIKNNGIKYSKDGLVYRYVGLGTSRIYIYDYAKNSIGENSNYAVVKGIIKDKRVLILQGVLLYKGVKDSILILVMMTIMYKLLFKYCVIPYEVQKNSKLKESRDIEWTQSNMKERYEEEKGDINYYVMIGILSIVLGNFGQDVSQNGSIKMVVIGMGIISVLSIIWYSLKSNQKGKKETVGKK